MPMRAPGACSGRVATAMISKVKGRSMDRVPMTMGLQTISARTRVAGIILTKETMVTPQATGRGPVPSTVEATIVAGGIAVAVPGTAGYRDLRSNTTTL